MKENIAFSGGATAGLGYFPLIKEIYNKDITFDSYAGVSAGGVMGVPLMSGMSPQDIKDILIKLEGDEYMQYCYKIEKAPKLLRPFMRIKQILGLRRKFFTSCEKLLKEKFPTWDRVNVLCKKSYIGFCLQKDVIKYLAKGSKAGVKQHGFKAFIKEKKRVSCDFYVKNIPVYYASDDGIYTCVEDCFAKVSNEVVPPWKAVLATFSNTLLPSVKIKINGKENITFDAGLIDSFAVLPFKGKTFLSAYCHKVQFPKNYYGIVETSEYLWNLYRGSIIKHCQCLPLKERAFFDFHDDTINEEYNRESTDFFKPIKEQ